MVTVTSQEVELLAALLQRAGMTPIEVIWANSVLERLRAQARVPVPGTEKEEKPNDRNDPTV